MATIRNRWKEVLLGFLVVGLGGGLLGCTSTGMKEPVQEEAMAAAEVPPATYADPGVPTPTVVEHRTGWPLPNHDYANTRATMDAKIDSSNVGTLGVAWVHLVPSGASTFGSISTTPIILGNDVYLQDIGNNFLKLDLQTGQEIWQKVYNLSNLGPNGVSVGYGKVYGSSGPYQVSAVDAATGKEVWRTKLIDIGQGQNGIDMQTTVYDGIVYISTVPGNAGVFYAGGGRGILYALDAETGDILWAFDTIESKDLWGHPNVNSGGGTWYPPAIDTETGVSYWGIANPAPFPGQPKGNGVNQDWPNGTSRPGSNLYTNSLVALDHSTGQMKWYTQVWPHGISDYDLNQSPILVRASWGGKQRDMVLGSGKMGRVYAFDRATGALLWQTSVGEHKNDRLAAWPTDGTISVLPGILGGVETPLAYAHGTVYAAANNLAVDFSDGLHQSLHPFSEASGDLVAIDVSTGQILWDRHFGSGLYGGATVVNDLVFTGTFDGMLFAFDRNTGKQLWSYKAPAAVNAWPAVSGDTIVWPVAGPGGPTSILGLRLGATEPAVDIVTPKAQADLPAGDVQVQVAVSNFDLVDKLGKGDVAGQGHLHYFLDVAAPTQQGKPAIPAQGSTWTATTSTLHTFKNVPAGPHTISVELVNNDHTPLNPPVVQTISIVTDTNPRIDISDPPNGAIREVGPITIHADVTNFKLADKLGQANRAGEGHIHYFMDVKPPTTPAKPAIPAKGSIWAATADTSHTFDNVPAGLHTFYVELVNNDHTPLDPPVTYEIQMYVIKYTGGLGAQ